MVAKPKLPLLAGKPVALALERQDVTHRMLSERSGVSRVSIRRALVRGFSWGQGDKVAAALGLHPCQLWGDAWLDLDRIYDELHDAAKERERAAHTETQRRYRARKAGR